MRQTGFKVVYELEDTTAREDGTPAAPENMDFADAALLKNNAPFPDYATLERNYFVLDGSLTGLPDSPDNIPFWSSALSDANGLFERNPVLTITFTENHTSTGLTFHFVGNYPRLMAVRWYDLSGNIISLKTFQPDRLDYYAGNLVENYGRLEIEFQRALPCRHIRLYGIDYGVMVTWDEQDIKTAKIVEETDPFSNTLKTNKLTFEFVDRDNAFNLANSEGLHRALQKQQHMKPCEIIDGKEHFLGRYFLTTPSSNKNLAKMEAMDYIGMLDDTEFKEGRVYNGELAGTVLAEIFDGTGIPYEVTDEVGETPLYGHLKIQSRRKALREVLFACGAAAETARRENVLIYKPDRGVYSSIQRSRKFSTVTKQDEYISDVSIKYAEYTPGTEEKELLKAAVYHSGLNTVEFSSPVSDLRISAGEIVKANANYLTFRLDRDTEITVYGKQYGKQELTVTSSIENTKAGEKRKSKSFTGTLFNYRQAKAVSRDILDYYQLSLLIDIRFLAEAETTGRWAEIENTLEGRGDYAAGLESMTTDLTGGFIAAAKLRGYYKLVTDYYYNREIYAGEQIGII